jgi:hypothetical protein
MQALSFTAHIPLVCLGIAFPVMVLLMERWGQRAGDPLYRTIARRWSRVMIALLPGCREHVVGSDRPAANVQPALGHPSGGRLPDRRNRAAHTRRSRLGARDRRLCLLGFMVAAFLAIVPRALADQPERLPASTSGLPRR